MSKKAEARVAQKLAAELKRKQREARVASNPESQVVRSEYYKQVPRQIRIGADPNSIFQMPMTYSLENKDCDGSWSWGPRAWSDEDWNAVILPKLIEYSRLTWGEIGKATTGSGEKRRKMHHDMPKNSIRDEAQVRIDEVAPGNDIIFRFRLGGLIRLWGFRVVSEFQILWFDPDHNIYPVD